MAKKIPERRCLGCMNSFPKSTLVRVVRDKEGAISLDLTGKKSGRGAYVCKSAECFKKAVKAKRFERALECEIPDSIYEEMAGELEGDK